MILILVPILVLVVVALLSLWHLRQVDGPAWVLRAAARGLHGDREPWGQAMLAELASIEDPRHRWRFALGAARVALIPPSRLGFYPAAVAFQGR